jgi:hypothetical protein
MRLTRLFPLALFMISLGCTQQDFELSLTNHTDQPLTIGVVKDGPPYEKDLASPGEWAIDTRLDSMPPWGHLLPPGRTMDSGKFSGSFPAGTRAYLRVYRGQHTNAELIGISESSIDRIDVLLFPGKNQLAIESTPQGQMNAKRLNGNIGAP